MVGYLGFESSVLGEKCLVFACYRPHEIAPRRHIAEVLAVYERGQDRSRTVNVDCSESLSNLILEFEDTSRRCFQFLTNVLLFYATRVEVLGRVIQFILHRRKLLIDDSDVTEDSMGRLGSFFELSPQFCFLAPYRLESPLQASDAAPR
jgi:hypothetical protein